MRGNGLTVRHKGNTGRAISCISDSAGRLIPDTVGHAAGLLQNGIKLALVAPLAVGSARRAGEDGFGLEDGGLCSDCEGDSEDALRVHIEDWERFG